MNKDESTDSGIAGCLLILLAIPLGVLCRGWALSALWGWFLTYYFGWPSPGVIGCYGLVLLFAVLSFRSDSSESKKSEVEKGIFTICHVVLVPLFALTVGWVLVQIRGV